MNHTLERPGAPESDARLEWGTWVLRPCFFTTAQ